MSVDPSMAAPTRDDAAGLRTPELGFSRCAKFFNAISIAGSVRGARRLVSVTSPEPDLRDVVIDAQAFAAEPRSSFALQLLLARQDFPPALPLVLRFSDGAAFSMSLGQVARMAARPHGRLQARFDEFVRAPVCRQILDLGGRARSGVLRAQRYSDKKVVVLDVMAGDGVDVVCDAHRMSEVLSPETFDAVYSMAVFEHLVMPWKVAVEMNRVMRPGAIALILTHQTIGMHDMPWDYFRFSDNAWKGLFNPATGFEILATELSEPQHILPMVYTDDHWAAEQTAGFEHSSVLVRKVSAARVDWPLSAADVTHDAYPV